MVILMIFFVKWIWFFKNRDEAIKCANKLYEENGKNMTITLNFCDLILVNNKLNLVSSAGLNQCCKLHEDVKKGENGIRITKTVIDTSPSDNFKSVSIDELGLKFDYWYRTN